jgi:hypothetical protein
MAHNPKNKFEDVPIYMLLVMWIMPSSKFYPLVFLNIAQEEIGLFMAYTNMLLSVNCTDW